MSKVIPARPRYGTLSGLWNQAVAIKRRQAEGRQQAKLRRQILKAQREAARRP